MARRSWLAATALLLALPLAPPAHAKVVVDDPVAAFAGTPTTSDVSAATAGDGSVAIARVYPPSDGAVEVQVRRPGRKPGAVTTLHPATAGVTPFAAHVLGGPDGTLAVLWYAGDDLVVRLLPPGSSTWSARRVLAVQTDADNLALDDTGRLWVLGTDPADPADVVVKVAGATGAVKTVPVTYPSATVSTGALTMRADGRATIAAVGYDSTGTAGGDGTPCTVRSRLLVADVKRSSSGVAMSQLDDRTVAGARFMGSCLVATGTSVEIPRLAPLGSTSTALVYGVTGPDVTGTEVWEVVRGPSGPFDADLLRDVATLDPGDIPQVLVPAGRQVAQVVQHSGSPVQQSVLVRTAGGPWVDRALTGAGGGGSVVAAGSPAGYAVFAWHELLSPDRMQVRVLGPNGKLTATTSYDSTVNGRMLAAGMDARGNAVAVHTFETAPGSVVARFSPIDVSGPRLTRVTVPGSATTGRKVRLRAAAVDVWSTVASYAWSLDGGKARQGRAITVAFGKAGRHRVTLVVTDGVGNKTSVVRSVLVERP